MSQLQISVIEGQWQAAVSNTSPPIMWAFKGTNLADQCASLNAWASEMSITPAGSGAGYESMGSRMGTYFEIGGNDSSFVFTQLFESTTELLFGDEVIFTAITMGAATIEAVMDSAGLALLAML